MQNYAPLMPLIISIALVFFIAIGRRQHSIHSDSAEVYYFPSVYKYLMVLASAFFALAPFWPGARGDANPFLFFGFFFVISLAAAFGAAFFHRYQVSISQNTFTVGAFIKRTFFQREIRDTTLVKGQKSADLFVYLKNGKQLRFSGLLTDFPQLTRALQPTREN